MNIRDRRLDHANVIVAFLSDGLRGLIFLGLGGQALDVIGQHIAIAHQLATIVELVQLMLERSAAPNGTDGVSDEIDAVLRGLEEKDHAMRELVTMTPRIEIQGELIDRPRDQKETVRRLGLHRIDDSVIKDDRPEIRGMIAKVRHLVHVEEVGDA